MRGANHPSDSKYIKNPLPIGRNSVFVKVIAEQENGDLEMFEGENVLGQTTSYDVMS